MINGAPVSTFDVDLVHSRNEANIASIIASLSDLEAHYRLQPERRLVPTASHLASAGHQNLITRFGPLDLIGTIGRNLGYEELLPRSELIDLGDGVCVRVLNLSALIEIKEQLNGDKDRAVLPVLRQTLKLSRKS